MVAQRTQVRPALINPNKGTERGTEIIEFSMRKDGAARSGVAAADGEMIAGSHSLEIAESLELPIREIHTNGTEYVVLVRDDIPSTAHPRARRLAVADNTSTLYGHAWDAPVLHRFELEKVELGPILYPSEIQRIDDKHHKAEAKAAADAGKPVEAVRPPEFSTIMARVPTETKARWAALIERQQGETYGEKVAAIIEKAEKYEDLSNS